MVLFSSTVSYYLKSDKIWILFLDLVGNSVATGSGSKGEAREALASPLFLDQSEARATEKTIVLTPPDLISGSG